MRDILAFGLTLLLPITSALANAERDTAKMVEHLRADPVALRVLLQRMPKGGDLHNHLDGSVYAEDYLSWASDDGDCIDKRSRTITAGPCKPDQVSARDLAARDPVFYQSTIDALSVRNFEPGTGTGEVSGHDHGFVTFIRFSAVASRHLGDMLAVTRAQADRDHVSYIEQIADPAEAFIIAKEAMKEPFVAPDFEKALAVLAPSLEARVKAAKAEFDAAEAIKDERLHCKSESEKPGCAVSVRHLYFVLRTLPPAAVFAQMALGYALVASDPRFVGINLVGPEDDAVALRDFPLHMAMFHFFQSKYPNTKLSLHAGELTLGLVAPSDLAAHIHDSIAIAGAKRIGHGYGIPFEREAHETLSLMAREHIAIEINLTSNAITPGISGPDHPFHLYQKAGVPAVLAADDEGVFRIDLTNEYVRAVLEQGVDYEGLKTLARNGIAYSFLPDAEKSALSETLERDFTIFEQDAASQ